MPPFLPTSTYIYIFIYVYTHSFPQHFVPPWQNEDFLWWPGNSCKVQCYVAHTNIPLPTSVKEQNGFSFTELNFIFARMQCHCYYLSSPQQANIYLYPAEDEFSISTFPISPRYSRAALGPLPELTHRQQLWWAVVLFQTPQAGKLCQSESLCLLITAVTSKPKLAIHEVTFILFPTLFLCPWLPELRFFSLLPALLVSKNRLSEIVTKTVWIQVTAKDLYYLCLSVF